MLSKKRLKKGHVKLLFQFRSKIGFGRFSKRPVDTEKLETDKAEVANTVKHIADYFLQDKLFIGGDDISVADLIGVMELLQLEIVGLEDLYESNEKVKAWVERIKTRCQPHFDEGMAKVMALKETYKNTKE